MLKRLRGNVILVIGTSSPPPSPSTNWPFWHIYISQNYTTSTIFGSSVIKSLVDPPGWGAAWFPGWWRIERRPLSAPPRSLRICGCSRCDFLLCLEHFSILDTASNVLVYLQISCITDTFCRFDWMISSCTWCFSQFGIVVQTTGKLLHTLVLGW